MDTYSEHLICTVISYVTHADLVTDYTEEMLHKDVLAIDFGLADDQLAKVQQYIDRLDN